MNTTKAITVCNNFLKCSEVVSWKELNVPLFTLALQYLITLAQEVEKEGNGLGDK
jgi:hypothetical protein